MLSKTNPIHRASRGALPSGLLLVSWEETAAREPKAGEEWGWRCLFTPSLSTRWPGIVCNPRLLPRCLWEEALPGVHPGVCGRIPLWVPAGSVGWQAPCCGEAGCCTIPYWIRQSHAALCLFSRYTSVYPICVRHLFPARIPMNRTRSSFWST